MPHLLRTAAQVSLLGARMQMHACLIPKQTYDSAIHMLPQDLT